MSVSSIEKENSLIAGLVQCVLSADEEELTDASVIRQRFFAMIALANQQQKTVADTWRSFAESVTDPQTLAALISGCPKADANRLAEMAAEHYRVILRSRLDSNADA